MMRAGASLNQGKNELHNRRHDFFSGLPISTVKPLLGSAEYGPTDCRRNYFVRNAEFPCLLL